jgi:hypothetical protein
MMSQKQETQDAHTSIHLIGITSIKSVDYKMSNKDFPWLGLRVNALMGSLYSSVQVTCAQVYQVSALKLSTCINHDDT